MKLIKHLRNNKIANRLNVGYKRAFSVFCLVSIVLVLSACNQKSAENASSVSPPPSSITAESRALQDSKDGRIYYIFDGKRHYVQTPATLQALGLETQVRGVSDSEVNQVALGDPLPPLSSKVIQKAGTGEVFMLEDGKRRHIPDPETLQSLHINKGQIQGVPDSVADAFPLGEPLPHAAHK